MTKSNKKYLVMLYMGRYEDQETTCLAATYTGKPDLGPAELLASFRQAATCAYTQTHGGVGKACPNGHNNIQRPDAAFCAVCGIKLVEQEIEPSGDRVLNYIDAMLSSTADDTGDLEELLREHGWDLWSGDLRVNYIASITGVRIFFEEEEYWEGSPATVQKIK
jgi:hypothetical protein